MIDKAKLAIALAVLFAGFFAYYQLPQILGQEVSILVRVGAIILAVVVAAAIAASSRYGASLIEFSKGSRTELRKMVWPTRAETIQTTGIVFVVVVLIALFLWLIDAVVFQVIYDLLLGVDD